MIACIWGDDLAETIADAPVVARHRPNCDTATPRLHSARGAVPHYCGAALCGGCDTGPTPAAACQPVAAHLPPLPCPLYTHCRLCIRCRFVRRKLQPRRLRCRAAGGTRDPPRLPPRRLGCRRPTQHPAASRSRPRDDGAQARQLHAAPSHHPDPLVCVGPAGGRHPRLPGQVLHPGMRRRLGALPGRCARCRPRRDRRRRRRRRRPLNATAAQAAHPSRCRART